MNLPNCFYRVSVKGLILNETRDKFLVCRESTGHWELPGGGLDDGETAATGLQREIEEEMGLPVKRVADTPCYFFTGHLFTQPDVPYANVVYECEVEHLNITPSDECLEYAFVTAAELITLKTFDDPHPLETLFDPANHQ